MRIANIYFTVSYKSRANAYITKRLCADRKICRAYSHFLILLQPLT